MSSAIRAEGATPYQAPKFKVRAAVVLLHANHVLVMRQNGKPFYVLPGGTLEAGEGVAACAIRELQEEANLSISLNQLLAVGDFIAPQRQVVEVFFSATLGEAYPPHQLPTFSAPYPENIDAIEWVSYPAFMTLVVQPAPAHQAIGQLWQQGQLLAPTSGGKPAYWGEYP
jgi:ADP-ribose pyrophosphatase YjhB (NUDIX family)